MRAQLVAIALGTALVSADARAQCGTTADAGCPVFTVNVAQLPAITAAPRLDIDAIIQENGASVIKNPNAEVFVTVVGSAPDGGSQSVVSTLSLSSFDVDAGVFTSSWDGGTPLFLGNNTIIVSALKPGARADSVPQLVRLDPSFDGGSTGGGGTNPDGGSGGGTLPDGGVSSSGAGLHLAAGDSSLGCSTTQGSPPSFLLMALAVMLAGLGRRAMRG